MEDRFKIYDRIKYFLGKSNRRRRIVGVQKSQMYDSVDKNGADHGIDNFSNWIWIFTIFIKRFETKNFNF